ncbi:TRAP transporter small permease [Thalassobacillus pellis]|uniref:TRAP transporter small permease n=1 Tax=Thalassobacillus pellis TaxID=748008 RepID=UPI0019607F22|nr:TRAP transporter small permease [Thalassobacillus pellis]MBM7553595.1 TRAP-type C4-dicarboxylate transport system permease small subunit [Thalassobacillus pellis]
MKRIRAFLYKLTKYINITMMFMLFLILLLQVFTRKFLNTPLAWPEELSLVTMIWITFFGAYQCTLENSHLKMDFLQTVIPEKYSGWFRILAGLVIIAFLGVTCFYGLSFVQKVGALRMPVTDLPMLVPYSIILVSCLLMLMDTILQMILGITSRFKGRNFPSLDERGE